MNRTVLRVFRREGEKRCEAVLVSAALEAQLRALMDVEEMLNMLHVSEEQYVLVFTPVDTAATPSAACTLDVVVGREIAVCCGILLPVCEPYHSHLHSQFTRIDHYQISEQPAESAIWLAEALIPLNR